MPLNYNPAASILAGKRGNQNQMVWQNSPYIQLSSVTLAMALNLVVYAWSRRKTAIGKAFIVLMAAIAEWSLMTVLQLCSGTFALQSFWHKLWYPGIVVVPVAWFVFVMIYTGHDKFLTPRNLFLLGLMPVLTLIATFTDDVFHLMFRAVLWDTASPSPVVFTVPNIWFWVHTIYSYSLMFLALIWLVKTFIDTSSIYRKQAGILLAGSLIPWIINLIFVLGPQIVSQVDPTPAAFAVTGLVAFWGLMRFQLLDIMPVARDTIVKDIRDGIIVVDANRYIVDLNPAAQGITGYSAHEIIGKPLGNAFPGKEKELDYLYSMGQGDTEIALGEDNTPRYYKIHTSPLYEGNRLRGHLLLLYDVTEQKGTAQRVQELRGEQQKLRQELTLSTRDKHEFMEYLTRELRTAFGGVLSDCRRIIAASPPEPYLSQMKNTHSKIAELDRRAQEFLDFLRTETGTIEIIPVTFDILTILKQASSEVIPLFQSKECALTADFPDLLPPVMADKERTLEVAAIFLRAALLLAPAGGRVEIHIQPDRDYLNTEFLISDVVIAQGEELFDPYSIISADGEPIMGCRVGLALCKRLVELSDGRVMVESNPQRGTKFSFSLPLDVQNADGLSK